MKLIVTADLHYDNARSTESARRIAEEICGLRADALLILGDVAGQETGILSECLHLFDRFEGLKLFVAGNHDVWTRPGENSLEKLEQVLPELCREADFHPLDVEPAVVDGVGIVGTMGWYDYSFRLSDLEVPLRFYQAKIAPGAAERFPEHQDLLADADDVPDTAMEIGTRWMDGQHVRLPMSDFEFSHYLLDRFRDHLDQAARRSEKIVVGMHHLAFWEIVPEIENVSRAFAAGFMGSEMFGEAILAEPKVRYAFFGHSHRPLRMQCGHVRCIDVGSTYVDKRYEIVDV